MKWQRVAITALSAILIMAPVLCGAAFSPSQLRALNFNLYKTPCPANDLVLQDLNGNPVRLSSLRGNVVLLNFWKIDCMPCAMEKPILQRMYQTFADQGLSVLAVNLSDTPERIRDYVSSHGYTFKFAHDPADRYSLKQQTLASGMLTNYVVNQKSEAVYEICGVPTTYVIDRQGNIVGHAFGMVNWEHGPFYKFLTHLLGPSTVVAGGRQRPQIAPPPSRPTAPQRPVQAPPARPENVQPQPVRPSTPQRPDPGPRTAMPVSNAPAASSPAGSMDLATGSTPFHSPEPTPSVTGHGPPAFHRAPAAPAPPPTSSQPKRAEPATPREIPEATRAEAVDDSREAAEASEKKKLKKRSLAGRADSLSRTKKKETERPKRVIDARAPRPAQRMQTSTGPPPRYVGQQPSQYSYPRGTAVPPNSPAASGMSRQPLPPLPPPPDQMPPPTGQRRAESLAPLPKAMPYIPPGARSQDRPPGPGQTRVPQTAVPSRRMPPADTPDRTRAPRPPVRPDSSGYVTAQIPDRRGPTIPRNEEFDDASRSTPEPPPEAQPVDRPMSPPYSSGGPQPFGGFIQDSFRETPREESSLQPLRPMGPPHVQPRGPAQPQQYVQQQQRQREQSLLGTIGSGVRSTLGALNPFR